MPHSPPFTITPAILTLVAEIAAEVGRLGALAGQGKPPMLRRENRIKSIHASLAIENMKSSPPAYSNAPSPKNPTAASNNTDSRPRA